MNQKLILCSLHKEIIVTQDTVTLAKQILSFVKQYLLFFLPYQCLNDEEEGFQAFCYGHRSFSQVILLRDLTVCQEFTILDKNFS